MLTIILALLIVVEVITSLLLVGVILLQKAKDEGLGIAFGVGMGETLFGSRAGNILTRITIGLAVVFLVNTALIAMLHARGASRSFEDRLPAGAPANAPARPEPGPLTIPAQPAPEAAPAGEGAAVLPAVPVVPAPQDGAPAPTPAPAPGP
jgi:protein translocase SecG subunit